MFRVLAAGLAVALLSGCGGGGGGGGDGGGGGGGGGTGGTGGGGRDGDTYAERSVAFEARAYIRVNASAPDLTALPVTGSTTYDGTAIFSSSPFSDMAGRLTLTADFAANAVSGQITDLRAVGEAPWGGTLTIGSAAIDRTSADAGVADFRPTLSGTMTSPGGTAYVASGVYDAGFFGSTAPSVYGLLVGGQLCAEAVCDPLSGEFNGDR